MSWRVVLLPKRENNRINTAWIQVVKEFKMQGIHPLDKTGKTMQTSER